MRTTALLLSAVLAALLVTESLSAPHNCQGETVIKASKNSKSSKSQENAADSSSVEIHDKSCSGDYSKTAKKSSSSSRSASADESSESFQLYKGGSPPCGDSLPPRNKGECDADYYKRIFPVDVNCKESVNAFYAKVFKQYQGESNCDYCKRIDFIFTKVYPNLDCRLNDDYIQYLEKYIVIKYGKNKNECDEDYFRRVLTKKCGDTEEQYTDKFVILKKYIKHVDWSKVKIVFKSETGYIIVKGKSTSTSTGKSIDDSGSSTCKSTTIITEEEAKKEYVQKKSEDTITYFTRITTKTSSTKTVEEYVQTVTIIRKVFPNLALWYDLKYIKLVKEYYTSLLIRKSGETDETFYSRIFKKDDFETDVQFYQRTEIYRNLFPNLPVWCDEKYFEKYTKVIYTTIFGKKDGECETDYFKRIVTKTDTETEDVYVKRMILMYKINYSLTVWYSEKYFTIVKHFYTLKYAKITKETDDVHIARIFAKVACESDEQIVQRVELVRRCYPNLPLWSLEKYYEKYTKNLYAVTYKRYANEEELVYYKRITVQTETETVEAYRGRLCLVQRTIPKISLWYSLKYSYLVKVYYTARYAKQSGECDSDFIKRLTAKEAGDTCDAYYAERIHVIHTYTASYSVWYDEKNYEQYTKTYYSVYYKKGSSETCDQWIKRVITLVGCESEDNAIKRITLINKSKCGCNCWTAENFSKVECDKSFSSGYLAKIKKTFIKKASSLTIKKSASESSSKEASASQQSSELSIKNC